MTAIETTLLFEYVQRVHELKRIVAQQAERIGNLEAIAQALADEKEWGLAEQAKEMLEGVLFME